MIDARGAAGVPCITTLPDPDRRAFVEDVLDEKLAAWQYSLLSWAGHGPTDIRQR